MPTAAVDDRGSVLYYEDSGIPPDFNGDYTTLVLVHGAGFLGATFRRLGPLAAECKLRLVTLNLRDYPGSTPYTPEALNDLRGPNRERQERARALGLGAFLQWLIRSQNTPPIRVASGSGARQGGISLISWSAGNCPTIALLAHADQLLEGTRTLLNTHLHTSVLRTRPRVDWGNGLRGASRHAGAFDVARRPCLSLLPFCLSVLRSVHVPASYRSLADLRVAHPTSRSARARRPEIETHPRRLRE
ncbi:hypothetical protein LXA43DRAFT_87606 [Ganoderma leucocontextum]|nr:hypothetical protein LXA43DRAFT_87606 [Ganoderma leucocontextum]